MVAWDEPRKFTREVLREEGLDDYETTVVDAVDVEFINKQTVLVDDLEYNIYDEGVKEFARLIGLNFGYVNKLPDELFAITLNYFLRRSEDMELMVFSNEDQIVTGVNANGDFRMTFTDVFSMINDACNEKDLLISEYTRDGENHVVTVLGEPVDSEEGYLYPSLTITLNDRLQSSSKHFYGVYRWGPKMVDNHVACETKIGKNEIVDTVLERLEEDISNSFLGLKEWFDRNLRGSSQHVFENPRVFFDKVLREAKVNKKRDEVLEISEIFDVPLSAFDIAIRISNTASVEAISKSLRKKLEGIAGYTFSHVAHDRRCKSCLSNLETVE